ncbi:hypothetical protein [Streptomyces coelicoflavus]|uniref:hypothetical protein n=1 Tax=Streptomyces coelicoflavus TaxID=285562 RepID=UPI0013C19F8F|nr:hypothetical protein [Streptomyces coelicoflavus]NEB63022.1 hypothetical protein [Streptomyces diastaticus]MCX5034679.1 hypothetical protein [Streptomyces coelicoflavus]MCX5039889.1 hypothetical protein [Streptomyces coelicoflavus]MCX5039908.1 hypothetical protein [Streptomyces coelicoflavus]MCX5041448.1 hypothetical protein [Streptomyces coelicoflavus]
MAEDQEYDEIDAVVRIPKGEYLADSRKSAGWKRGFTPKTSDKGPEHVEIRLKAEKESGSTDKPEIVYVTEYAENQRPQLTPGQQAVADIAYQIIGDLVEIAKPRVAHWWHTRAAPVLVAKGEALVLKQQARRAQKKALRAGSTTTPVAVPGIEADAPSQNLATAPSDPKVTVTSQQFQQMFMTWLAREDAQQALWSLIVNAEVEDGGAATLAWQQELKELSPEQRTERVMEFLTTNPSILEEFARQLMGSMALGLSETTLRRDRP